MFENLNSIFAQSKSIPTVALIILIGIVIAVIIFLLKMEKKSSSDEKKGYFEAENSKKPASNNHNYVRSEPPKKPASNNFSHHETEPQTNPASISPTITSKFATLLGYGKFMSGAGWVLIIIAALIFLARVASSDNEITIMFAIMGSFVSALTGFLLVVSGQAISCFVSIEKNTRLTSELLKEQNQTIMDR